MQRSQTPWPDAQDWHSILPHRPAVNILCRRMLRTEDAAGSYRRKSAMQVNGVEQAAEAPVRQAQVEGAASGPPLQLASEPALTLYQRGNAPAAPRLYSRNNRFRPGYSVTPRNSTGVSPLMMITTIWPAETPVSVFIPSPRSSGS